MSLRFSKSIKLAPGVRLNISKSGLGLSAGPRGLSMSVGVRDAALNTGISGTGVSVRHQPTNLAKARRTPPPTPQREHAAITELTVSIELDDDGALHIRDAAGVDMPAHIVAAAKQQQAFAIQSLIEAKCAEINRQIDALVELHLNTPVPQAKRFVRFEEDIYSDTDSMSAFLEDRLQEIMWPRETLVSAEIVDGGRVVYLDVDLPEIEDLPRATASMPQHGLRLSVKEMSETKVRQLYMQHVHAIGFRIVGETFAALPASQQIVLSTYSQRADHATGQIEDQYLYSVRIDRDRWSTIKFSALPVVDVVECFARFDLRRKMTKTGVFTPVEPFDLPPP